jgi:hypothetical protein
MAQQGQMQLPAVNNWFSLMARSEDSSSRPRHSQLLISTNACTSIDHGWRGVPEALCADEPYSRSYPVCIGLSGALVSAPVGSNILSSACNNDFSHNAFSQIDVRGLDVGSWQPASYLRVERGWWRRLKH